MNNDNNTRKVYDNHTSIQLKEVCDFLLSVQMWREKISRRERGVEGRRKQEAEQRGQRDETRANREACTNAKREMFYCIGWKIQPKKITVYWENNFYIMIINCYMLNQKPGKVWYSTPLYTIEKRA